MNIAKRIFIGVAIAMIVWFLKTEVFALTVDSRLQLLQADEQTVVNTSYVSAGTLMSYTPSTSYPGRIFTRVFVRFTQPFTAGSTYRFEYQYNVSRYDYEFRTAPCGDGFIVSSGATIVSSSCSSAGVTQNVKVTVRFDSALSSVTIGSVYYTYLAVNQTYNFRVIANSWDITDIDSTYEAITNNTEIISNAMEGISNYIDYQTAVIETVRDLLHDFIYTTIGDEQATIYNDSGYSGINVNGYENAHSSGTNAGGSGLTGANNLSFDIQSYDDASTTIWDYIYSFLSLNSKLLTYLTSILTLGFVKVVFNR